jgi:hypothetical protein
MTETRVLKISKDAFKDKTRKRKIPQKGGYDNAPEPQMPTPSLTPSPPIIQVNTPSATATPATTPAAGGGRKLHLAPKKEKLALVKNRSQTRKVVRIQMQNLRKSIRRAKDIVTESKEKPIEEIEEILSSANIIKKRTTDAPMSEGKQKTIRGIYRDYLQLRLNAL